MLLVCNEGVKKMEIRKLEIDFDNNVLKINGNQIKNRPVIASLPGPDGFMIRKLFNSVFATGSKNECDKLEVHYSVNLKDKQKGVR